MNRKGERHTVGGDDIPSIQFSLPTAARVDMRREKKNLVMFRREREEREERERQEREEREALALEFKYRVSIFSVVH